MVPVGTEARVSTQTRSDTATAKRISGGHLVARALKAEGIKTIFTLSGGHVMDIYNGCIDEGITIIGVRHEQARGARRRRLDTLNRHPRWAVVTAGPGVEFDTCVRHNLPVIAVVGTNATWGMVRYGPISRYGKSRGDVANLLLPTRYDRIVEDMGGYGEYVTQPKDIRPALERARASGKPACVNLIVDPEIYSPTTLRNTFYKY